jgi:hypothetical protein
MCIRQATEHSEVSRTPPPDAAGDAYFVHLPATDDVLSGR